MRRLLQTLRSHLRKSSRRDAISKPERDERTGHEHLTPLRSAAEAGLTLNRRTTLGGNKPRSR